MRKSVVLDPRLVKSERITCEVAIEAFRNEILRYLQDVEQSPASQLNPVMIDNQPEIRWNMRPYIVDFLVELHLFFKLSQETLFLACFIADKYCTRRIVYKRHYQLLVVTSLWIAAKYQEKKTRVPTLKELCLLCHQIYDSAMILQMERHILGTLEWCIGNSVSTYDMVQCLLSSSSTQTIPEDSNLMGLSYFLCDLTLYQRDFMFQSPSTRAITAVLLASRILNIGNFPAFLSQLVAYPSEDDDSSFHIGTDASTNDVSLSLSRQTVDNVRFCLQLFLNDIFNHKIGNTRDTISDTLLRKYKHLPIQNWLSNYKSNTLQIYTQLSSLNDSLKLTNNSPYSASSSSFLKESVCSCLDEIAGFKNTNPDLHSSMYSMNQLNLSSFTPPPSSSSVDLSMPTRWSLSTPTRYSIPQSFMHYSNVSFTPGHSKPYAACPTTPGSANSVFSAAPRLGNTSRSSSFSSIPGVSTSNSGLLKSSCTRGSTANFKRSFSSQETVPSIYEFSFT